MTSKADSDAQAFLMVLRAATLLGWFGSGSKASSTSAKKRN